MATFIERLRAVQREAEALARSARELALPPGIATQLDWITSDLAACAVDATAAQQQQEGGR